MSMGIAAILPPHRVWAPDLGVGEGEWERQTFRTHPERGPPSREGCSHSIGGTGRVGRGSARGSGVGLRGAALETARARDAGRREEGEDIPGMRCVYTLHLP
ncbi:hypothetical protein KIPB_014823 [Kipferlia bialata]|uniref:Uncharacterized protein n=1 Tax=Kipferlia bialata TaxID=797122 RepID=A0A391PB24_9EUKA|nr:hypothetical protein KIPB_014823 [Kipferlia bialata]|eukprot:g14823.t1